MEEKTQVTVRLPDSLVWGLKKEVVRQRINLQTAVQRAIEQWLAEHQASADGEKNRFEGLPVPREGM